MQHSLVIRPQSGNGAPSSQIWIFPSITGANLYSSIKDVVSLLRRNYYCYLKKLCEVLDGVCPSTKIINEISERLSPKLNFETQIIWKHTFLLVSYFFLICILNIVTY